MRKDNVVKVEVKVKVEVEVIVKVKVKRLTNLIHCTIRQERTRHDETR